MIQLDSVLRSLEISLLSAGAPGKSVLTQNMNFQEIKKKKPNPPKPNPQTHCTFTCFRLLFFNGNCKVGNTEVDPGTDVSVVQSCGREKALAACPAETGSEPVSPTST